MAGSLWVFGSGEVAIAVATRKVIIGVMGADNYYRGKVKRFGISANGVVAAGKPVYVRFCVASQGLAAGTVVNPSPRTKDQMDYIAGANTFGPQVWSTGRHSSTLPTSNVRAIREGEIHPNGGMWVEGFAKDEEPEIITAGLCYWIDALGDTILSLSGWIEIEE